ncbi:GreA/GreB family elongation factor [Pseudonocardia sp.]|uniref:GreA/GreB family elongation factor n=1 Tax=Pseudonocardia sp. TaxID=60912 RepID=UPI003D0E385D
MTETQVWLARDAHERLRAELRELLRQRSDAVEGPEPDGSTDHQLMADRRDRDHRIRKLQEVLQNPIVGQEPPDDGVAEPGMVLTVRYEDDQETETFLLAHHDDGPYAGDLMTCSPDSPLGSALPGRRQGDTVQYLLPDGQPMRITLLRAVPYRRCAGRA